MAGYSARQSSYSDGDVITAAQSNTEFDTLLAAFNVSSGHTHDGSTAGDGGPITTLFGSSLTFGSGADSDITISFNTSADDGQLKWVHDADHFKFMDEVVIDSTSKLYLNDKGGEHISGDGTDLTIASGNDLNLTATTDINIPANVGLTFGNDAEKIEGDGTDLTITGNNINLTATADIVIPADVGITFGSGEKIEGDSTDLTITSGAKINLTATSDVHIPNNVGIVFGGDSEKIEGDGTDMTISANNLTVDAVADIILDAGGANVTFKDDGTSILDIANNSGDAELTVSTADKNFAIKGTDDSSAITALDIDMALAGKATFSGDVVVTGDLTVTGDDITMGTNTSGHIMVADGANFNPVPVGGDVTIASDGAVTIASGAVEGSMLNPNVITGQTAETSLDTSNDTILIHDADASALKKVTLASLSSGLGGITDVVADTSPQLGGNLDTNSHNILIDDAHFIGDENSNEQIIFQTTASAVNQFDITNAATGNAPELSATGDDTNISLKITPKGSGQVVLDGNVGIESGVIDLKNAGSQSYIRFYCESANQHYVQVQAPAHSDFTANQTITLPATTDTLVGRTTTDTLTNKSIDSDNNTITNIVNADIKSSAAIADTKLATISTAGKVALTALEIDGGTDIGGDLSTSDLIIVDDGAGGTNRKAALSRVVTLMSAQGFSTDDPTALAIALG